MKTVGYIRVSTHRQDISLSDQRERLEQYCKFKNLDLVEIFSDEVSASVPLGEREGGEGMMDLLKEGQVLNIVTLKLDRMFRSTIDALTEVNFFNESKISLHIVDMGGTSVDTSSAMGKMMLTMMAAFAELERNLISERTAAALDKKRRDGDVYTGRGLYGYKDIGGKFIKQESEFNDIVNVFKMRLSGMSLNQIADSMNHHLGTHWQANRILRILKTKKYLLDIPKEVIPQ